MSVYRGKAQKRQMVEVGKQPWLPQQVQVSLHEIVGAAKERLLALAVAVVLDVLRSMMEAEVTAIVGPKGKHNPNRKAFRHGTRRGGACWVGGRCASSGRGYGPRTARRSGTRAKKPSRTSNC
jgi:putative transposase